MKISRFILIFQLAALPVFAQSPPATGLLGRWVAGTGIHSSGANPDLISQWDDQSGNGYNLTQGTDANKPYNAVDLSGAPIVRFAYGYPTNPTQQ